MAVVWSHYGTKKQWTREQVYAAGNGIADWLGLGSWTDVVVRQNPAHVKKFRRLLATRE